MRLRLFLLLLGVPLLLTGGLVVVLRIGRSTVHDRVAPSAGGGAAQKPARDSRGVRLARIGTFDSPVYVTSPPGDGRRLFVVEQTGKIRVIANGKRRSKPFLDLTGDIVSGGEQGLLSMAFAPDYSTSGRFYVDFTDRNGDSTSSSFSESKQDPNRANRSSRRQVLFAKQPYPNHNGGLLLFGPDKLLYVGLGDGGSAGDPQNRAQNLDALLGKILRIDPAPRGRLRLPVLEPVRGACRPRRDLYVRAAQSRGASRSTGRRATCTSATWARTRTRRSTTPRAGGALGRDYGWSCFEGLHRYDSSRSCPNPTPPVLEYSHAGGGCSVTGGVVVRDPRLPSLAGRYLYGDFCRGRFVHSGSPEERRPATGPLGLDVPSLSSFGRTHAGGSTRPRSTARFTA